MLKEHDIHPWIIRWIANVLICRKVALRCGSWTSEIRTIVPGLPQGSPLSPVLFNVYTLRIAQLQTSSNCRVLTYADDILLLYNRGRNRTDIADSVQSGLYQLSIWCRTYNAVINPSKAKVVWYSLNNNLVIAGAPSVAADRILRVGISFF